MNQFVIYKKIIIIFLYIQYTFGFILIYLFAVTKVSSTNIFLHRALTIKCSTYRQARWWGHSIDDFSQMFGQDFLRENRHGSFTPVRENTTAKW